MGVMIMAIQNHALMAMISQRLQQDHRVSSLSIDVICTDGCVCLRGTVDTPDQKKLAMQLLAGMIGVSSVQDELAVKQAITQDAVKKITSQLKK